MPIEVKELVIRVKVNENSSKKEEKAENLSPAGKRKLVDECVEKVIEKLELRLER